MVSIRSATYSLLLIQLVFSCTAIVASLAIVSAQAQSIVPDDLELKPSIITMVNVCLLSFGLMISSIFAMFGLSGHKSNMLLPVICFSIIVCIFYAFTLVNWILDWISEDFPLDADWLIIMTFSLFFQVVFLLAVYLEIRCYRYV